MALINTTTTGVLGSTFYADGSGDLTIQQNGVTVNKITSTGFTIHRPGTVLQVVNATHSASTSASTTTYVDTGLTASITPSSASSKILVIVEQAGLVKSNDTFLNLKLQRNGADLIAFSSGTAYTGTATTNYVGNSGASYLDSPATTSSTTYKTVVNSGNNVASVTCQVNSSVSTITLMEIAA
jgi:hypothetical protein